MSFLALSAALGASFSWAAGSILAHAPARHLGAFEFTRTQLISSATLLLLIVTAVDEWTAVAWQHWPGFAISSLVGVVVGNLAMAACLRRGGPRRTQVLLATNAPIAAALGYIILGETISVWKLVGAALVFLGVVLAILYGREDQNAVEPLRGTLAWVIALGLLSAACNAIGLVALKPALLAGTPPLAASALRTGGGALAITVIALWPAKSFEPISTRTGSLILQAVFPGLLGYVLAVTLLLYGLRSHGTAIVAVLGSTSPVMMLPMIWATTRKPPSLHAWAGACLVVLGTGTIFLA